LKKLQTDIQYKKWLADLKNKVRSIQIKAAIAVNKELLTFYWELGADIVQRQSTTNWGDSFLSQLSADLMDEFPDMKGFSVRNLKYVRQWYLFYCSDLQTGSPAIGQQLVAQFEYESRQHAGKFVKQDISPIIQIPWGHNIVVITKIKNVDEAIFYVQKTIQNNWSRAVLTHHIESGLYSREGKAITNFHATLPTPQSDLARQTLKDPYKFDFLNLREKHDEKELEDALINHVTKFLFVVLSCPIA